MKLVKHPFTAEEMQSFDSSRGFLALIVVIAHINQITWFSVYGVGPVTEIVGLIANISVVIFFFLSGVLITYSGTNMMDENAFNYKKFFINRFTRIYPTLIASLILIVVLIKLFPLLNDNTFNIKKLPNDLYSVRDRYFVSTLQILKTIPLLFSKITNVNGPMWSLFIEWWLYISAMFIFMGIKQKNTYYKYTFLIISIIPLLYIYNQFRYPGMFYIIIWFLGFLYTTTIRNHPPIKRYLLIASTVIVVALLYIMGLIIFNIKDATPFSFGFVQIFFAIVYLNFFKKMNFLHFFKFFSPFSYTLYLIHFPILLFIHSTLRIYTGSNLFYLAIETIFDFIVVVTISYYLAKITEDKNFFRRFFAKNFNIGSVNSKS